jgi:predicted nucleotidyltransferase
MRLQENEIEIIKSAAKSHFGENVKVSLFGSRTQDERRGGDIDLFVSTPEEEKLKIRNKVDFITDLDLKIGDQRIDVVLDRPSIRNSDFYQTIRKNAIQL